MAAANNMWQPFSFEVPPMAIKYVTETYTRERVVGRLRA
jgi:hypothetical protein